MGMKITRRAQKQLLRMDRRYAERIVKALMAYEKEGTGDVKPLKGRPGYRLRVGDYRAIFEMDAGEILVLDAGPRGGIYT